MNIYKLRTIRNMYELAIEARRGNLFSKSTLEARFEPDTIEWLNQHSIKELEDLADSIDLSYRRARDIGAFSTLSESCD